MSESKFKVGDKVVLRGCIVRKITNVKQLMFLGKPINSFVYNLDNSPFDYREEYLNLVENRIYTGIELLQAIKDGVFKDGDEFETTLTSNKNDGYGVVVVCKNHFGDYILAWRNRVDDVTVDYILNFTFTPIKKNPINIAKVDKVLDAEIPVTILGRKELINAKVTIKGNKIVVKLPSGVKGVSSCCPEDRFDEDKGIKIASARAIKNQIIRDLDKGIEELVK